jgi:hypothetical protein
MNLHQYCIYTQHPEFKDVLTWVDEHDLRYELHFNRTRFWIPTGKIHTEFMLRWYHCCSRVVDNEDLATGTSSSVRE